MILYVMFCLQLQVEATACFQESVCAGKATQEITALLVGIPVMYILLSVLSTCLCMCPYPAPISTISSSSYPSESAVLPPPVGGIIPAVAAAGRTDMINLPIIVVAAVGGFLLLIIIIIGIVTLVVVPCRRGTSKRGRGGIELLIYVHFTYYCHINANSLTGLLGRVYEISTPGPDQNGTAQNGTGIM